MLGEYLLPSLLRSSMHFSGRPWISFHGDMGVPMKAVERGGSGHATVEEGRIERERERSYSCCRP